MTKRETILCPHCKGHVAKSWRQQTLEEALERHQHLSHGVVTKPPAAPSKPVLSKTPKRKAPKR